MRAYTHACVSTRAATNVRAGTFLQSILPSPQPAADERAVLDARRGRVRGAPVGKRHEARCEAQVFWNRRAEEGTERGASTCLPLLLFFLLFLLRFFVVSCDVVAESCACREFCTLVFFIYACLHRPPAHHSLALARWAAFLYPRSLVFLFTPAPPTRPPLARFCQVGCLFVSAIARDGLVYRYPRITLGARLLELDGHCLLSSSREFVAGIIENCHERNAPVKMVLQIVDRMQARTNFLPSRSHART
jgi:hypothetical protein